MPGPHDRTVVVRLRADAKQYIAEMAAASAATKGFGREAGLSSDGATGLPDRVAVDRDKKHFVAALHEARDEHESFWRSMNTSNDRNAWLVQGVMALTPAVTTLGAGAIPVLSGLATQATLTAAAVGTVALAFNGVGDALKALNKYQEDGSAANLAKLEQAMAKIGPEGERMVRFLDSLGPQLAALANMSRAEMFPGAISGIESLMTMLPRFKVLITEISGAVGDLMASAGEDLAGPEWAEFFDWLSRTARPVLTEMGNTLGNFAQGLGSMLVAFDPLTRSFSAGFEDMSKSFADWAANLDSSEGFQHFLDYVRDAAPKALDFLGSLSMAIVEIVEASAPVGAVALPLLTKLLDVVGALADTPLGSLVIGLGALTASIGRMRALGELMGGGGLFAQMTTNVRANMRAVDAASPSWRQFGDALYHFGQRADLQSESTKRAMDQTKQMGKAMAPIAGQVALAAFAMSDYDDQLGVTNTAALTLAGSLAGPLGVGAGFAAGAALDLAAASRQSAEALERTQAAIKDATTYDQYAAALQRASDLAKTAANGQSEYFNSLTAAQKAWQGWDALLTGETALHTMYDQAHAARDALAALDGAMVEVGKAFGEKVNPDNMDEMQAIATRAEPAMRALGITVQDLANMDPEGMRKVAIKLNEWTIASESTAGRSQMLAEAVAGLDDELVSTADSAAALKAALDELTNPQMNLQAATDAWIMSLRTLKDDLSEGGRALRGNSTAAIENRAAIRSRVEDLKAMLTAEADAGASAGQLSRKMRNSIAALLDNAAAAGLSRREVRAMIEQFGLTPKLIRTLFKTNAREAMSAAQALKAQLDSIDRFIPVNIHVNRTGDSPGDIFLSGGVPRAADGGTVPKTGMPYADRHPYMLADGEEVTSNRFGQADAYRPILKAISANLPRAVIKGMLADGGTAGRKKAPRRSLHTVEGQVTSPWEGVDISADFDALADALWELRKEMGNKWTPALERHADRLEAAGVKVMEASERYEAAQETLDALLSEQKQYVEKVQGLYTTGFSKDQSLGDWMRSARGDIAGRKSQEAALAALRAMGLDPESDLYKELASGENARLAAQAAASPEAFARMKALYEERAALNKQAGASAGELSYGRLVERQTEITERLQMEVVLRRRDAEVQNRRLMESVNNVGSVIASQASGAGRRRRRQNRRHG